MTKVLYLVTNEFIKFTDHGTIIHDTRKGDIIPFLIRNQNNPFWKNIYELNKIQFPLIVEELELVYD